MIDVDVEAVVPLALTRDEADAAISGLTAMIEPILMVFLGGIVGGAFHEGVLRALNDATGWNPRDAEVIVGTSAGSPSSASSSPLTVPTVGSDRWASRRRVRS